MAMRSCLLYACLIAAADASLADGFDALSFEATDPPQHTTDIGVGVFFGVVAGVSLLAACFSCVMMILHFARQRRRMRLAQHEEVRLEAR